jgi:hypothetical protein
MLTAMFNTYAADTSLDSQELPFDLTGVWAPSRHDEWYNRLPGKHRQRARASSTKMTYDSDGNGSGWVGEVYVHVQARVIAPGRYTCKFQVQASPKTLPWAANDGRMTLLEDGTLQVQYPSHGIREFWRREDGRGIQILREAREKGSTKRSRSSSKPCKENDESAANRLPSLRQRKIRLVFRGIGGDRKDKLLWHWGLSVDDSIYEVNGAMAVMGPNGVVAASSPLVKKVCTDLSQFHGYLDLPQGTRKANEEIEEFSRRWVKLHPVYKALGPNCQTYTEDLFTFLTGEDLLFAKTADKIVGNGVALQGPHLNPNSVWLDERKKP